MGGSKLEDDKIRIQILEDVLTCQFRSTYKNIFFDRSRSSDDRFRSFYDCVGIELHKVDGCLHQIQDLCDRSLIRIAKVIRIDVDNIHKMLEKFPDLKVIHLLRDPRAVFNSLQQMRLHFGVKRKARAICNNMKKNVIAFEEIFKFYPDQTTTMFFESLAKNPIDMTKKLYDFIGVRTTHTVIEWVKKNMHGKKLDTGTYSVKNRNSLGVSNKWRNQMRFEDIVTIDSVCRDFYDISGYFEVMSPEHLNESKIAHFRGESKLIVSDLEHRTENIILMNKNDLLK